VDIKSSYQNSKESEGKEMEAWLPEAGMRLRQKMKQDLEYTCYPKVSYMRP
jgi:hypothetical protein